MRLIQKHFWKLSSSLIALVAVLLTIPFLLARPVPAGHDEDRDGLHTRFELLLGTDPFNRDSDGDGLSDGQEVVNVNYFGQTRLAQISYDVLSNALAVDSDYDGLLDGDEGIANRMNAANVDTSSGEPTVLTPLQ